ncbi:MAG TPA: hypothetical protein VF503_19460 [Sphingobium sp.]|uniref:hypothetical protein n=1 Tax=Sphingobium sp. TaxID=1912891 RepID=UPI002ED1AD10
MPRFHRHAIITLLCIAPPLHAAPPNQSEPVIGFSVDTRRIIANAEGAFAIIKDPGSWAIPVHNGAPTSPPGRKAVGLGNSISIDAALFGNALSGGTAR